MSAKYKTYQVEINDPRTIRYRYIKSDSHQKEQEKFESIFYEVINQIVDAGGIIDPGKYFSESGYFSVRATEEVSEVIAKISNVKSVS
jgi:hypothetical protein